MTVNVNNQTMKMSTDVMRRTYKYVQQQQQNRSVVGLVVCRKKRVVSVS